MYCYILYFYVHKIPRNDYLRQLREITETSWVSLPEIFLKICAKLYLVWVIPQQTCLKNKGKELRNSPTGCFGKQFCAFGVLYFHGLIVINMFIVLCLKQSNSNEIKAINFFNNEIACQNKNYQSPVFFINCKDMKYVTW